MIIRIVKPYQSWRPGETPDIMRSLAQQLIAAGIAVPFGQRTAELKNTIKLSTPPPPAVVVAQPMPADMPAPRRRAARKVKDNNTNTHS
jgi:hypothetical protein